MTEIELENVKAVKPGDIAYRHRVMLTRKMEVEEVAVVTVLSANSGLSDKEWDAVWRHSDGLDWDEVDAEEKAHTEEITSSSRFVPGRCKFTADMFEEAK